MWGFLEILYWLLTIGTIIVICLLLYVYKYFPAAFTWGSRVTPFRTYLSRVRHVQSSIRELKFKECEDLVREGRILVRNQEYPEAIKCFNKALKIKEDSDYIYILRSLTYFRMKDFFHSAYDAGLALHFAPDSIYAKNLKEQSWNCYFEEQRKKDLVFDSFVRSVRGEEPMTPSEINSLNPQEETATE